MTKTKYRMLAVSLLLAGGLIAPGIVSGDMAGASAKTYTMAQTLATYRAAVAKTDAKNTVVQRFSGYFWLIDDMAGISSSLKGTPGPTIMNPKASLLISTGGAPGTSGTSSGWVRTQVTQVIGVSKGVISWYDETLVPTCKPVWTGASKAGYNGVCASAAYPVSIYDTSSNAYWMYPGAGARACWNDGTKLLRFTMFPAGSRVYTTSGAFKPMTRVGNQIFVWSSYPGSSGVVVHERDIINVNSGLFTGARYIGIKAGKQIYSYNLSLSYPAQALHAPAVSGHMCQ